MNIVVIISAITLAIVSGGQCDLKSTEAAATALMKYYDQSNGLWANMWWNSANALTSIIDFMILTDTKTYLSQVQNTFDKARNQPGAKDFCNEFVDDSGWWGLGWVRAYDMTKEAKYLQMAEHIADCMYQYHDNVCKGGLYWKTDKKNKNAIPNELFIKLAASLHNRVSGDTKYLNQAKEVWTWFNGTGMINSEHLINDGLKDLTSCKPDGQTYTYNQGVILGGLVELNHATNDQAYLNQAVAIADAATKSTFLNPNGILKGPGESDGCNNDGASFKGVFVRNLGELSKALSNHPYHDYLVKQAQSAYDHDRNDQNQYGDHWAGPLKETGMPCQHSALDVMDASLK